MTVALDERVPVPVPVVRRRRESHDVFTIELDASALTGIPVAEQLFDHEGSPSTIYVRSDTQYLEDVRSVLGRTANPEDPSDIEVTRPSDALEARAAAATAFTELFLGLGAVALIVGGVGIANVMIMSVLERRSEIGLRRAVGATRRAIAQWDRFLQMYPDHPKAEEGRATRLEGRARLAEKALKNGNLYVTLKHWGPARFYFDMVMKDGRVVEAGLTDRVLDDPHAPYTQLLVSSILQV